MGPEDRGITLKNLVPGFSNIPHRWALIPPGLKLADREGRKVLLEGNNKGHPRRL